MSWVNLNEVYVPKTGGNVDGDLEVAGSLAVNDASGEGTAYNVAEEITNLKEAWDSVSPSEINGFMVTKRPDGYLKITRSTVVTNISCTTTYGNLYYHSTGIFEDLELPVPFVEVYSCTSGCSNSSIIPTIGSATGEMLEMTVCPLVWLYSAKSYAVDSAGVYLCIEGRWK